MKKEGFVPVDQGKLYYRIFGEGVPLVVLHGGPGLDQNYLLPQLLSLSEHHQLIFYDQRGSGRSLDTPVSPDLITLEQFTKDLEDLRESLGLGKFILMGHSWGAVLALNYAIHHQDHLGGLILSNSSASDFEGRLAGGEETGRRLEAAHIDISAMKSVEEFAKLGSKELKGLYQKLFSVYFNDPNQVEELSLDFDVKAAQSGLKVMGLMRQTSIQKPEFSLFPQLGKIRVPTFMIHGREDIFPVWTAEKTCSAISGAELVILESCGHFPYIEQPDAFFRHLSYFLNQTSTFMPGKR